MSRPARSAFLSEALGLMGTPYLWGGKVDLFLQPETFRWVDPPYRGVDCSGVPTVALYRAGGPDLRRVANTDWLLNRLPATEEPKPGDLCLYGPSERDASHVMVWLGACGLVFGASNGDSNTLTLGVANTRRACVKVKSSRHYRPGFLGFRSLSPYLEEE